MSGEWKADDSPEAAVLVHPEPVARRLGEAAWEARAEEFRRLVEAAGCAPAAAARLPLRRLHPGLLLGQGQVEEVARLAEEAGAPVVFVDHPLSPVQQRNLEKAWKTKVVDRTGLILEIFAARARTREGVLQVELASLSYQLGRLVRSWTHLERQRGGVGFMGGPGERQIELDRRMIRDRIRQLKKELEKVRRMRATQRAGRKRKDLPTVALVGYTNAGKSTLFNRLTACEVLAADKLFATLDPTLRLLELPGGRRVMLSDTVGFVQELPHELVDAFRATLEEVTEADLILHVRDASDPMMREQGEVVRRTLEQLFGDAKREIAPPVVEVWNKKDRAPSIRSRLREEADGSRIALSAATGEGLDELCDLLAQWAARAMREMTIRLDPADGRTLAFCHARGRVLSREDEADGAVRLRVLLHPRDAARLKEGEDGFSRLD